MQACPDVAAWTVVLSRCNAWGHGLAYRWIDVLSFSVYEAPMRVADALKRAVVCAVVYLDCIRTG